MPPKKTNKPKARAAAAAGAPRPAAQRKPKKNKPPRAIAPRTELYTRALMEPFSCGVGMKYPDLSCRASATSWSMLTLDVMTNSNGTGAFCFNPSSAALFTMAGNILAASPTLVTWQPSFIAPQNLAALTGSSSQYRCVSAGLMFVPSTSVTTGAGLFCIAQTTTVPAAGGTTPVSAYNGASNATFVPITNTWTAFWKPMDFESVTYSQWAASPPTGTPENNITYIITGAPVSTTIGKLVYIANWEVLVDVAATSVLTPTPALCDLTMLQHAANATGSLAFVDHMAYMTGGGPGAPEAAGGAGDSVGGAMTAGGWSLGSIAMSSIVTGVGSLATAHLWHMNRRARHAMSSLGGLRRYD